MSSMNISVVPSNPAPSVLSVTATPSGSVQQTAQKVVAAAAGSSMSITATPSTNPTPLNAKITPVVKTSAGEIRLVTVATGGSRLDATDRLEDKKEVFEAMKGAFNGLKSAIMEHEDYKDVAWMTVRSNSNTPVTLCRDNGEKIHCTFNEIKDILFEANKAPAAPQIKREEIEKAISGYFQKFYVGFSKAGITGAQHYMPHATTIGSYGVGRALDFSRFQDQRILNREASSLRQDVKKKKQPGILNFIERTDKTKHDENVDKIVLADLFVFKFRQKIVEKIDTLKAENLRPNKEKELELKQYETLLKEMNELNHRALWMGGIYNNKEDCYQQILVDYMKDLYPKVSSENELLEHSKLPKFRPFREHAAEVASLLIDNLHEYSHFCREHNIGERQNHINRLFSLALKDSSKIDQIDLKNLGYSCDHAGIHRMIKEAHADALRLKDYIVGNNPGGDFSDRAKRVVAAASSVMDKIESHARRCSPTKPSLWHPIDRFMWTGPKKGP